MDPKFFYAGQNSSANETTADSQGINIGTEATGAEEEPQEIDFLSLKLAANEAHLAIKKLKEPYY